MITCLVGSLEGISLLQKAHGLSNQVARETIVKISLLGVDNAPSRALILNSDNPQLK